MRFTSLFTKTTKNISASEVSKNAQLLMRGSFIHKNSAGVYSYLPLGWRVLQNISEIVRQEMNALGAQEVYMPVLVENKYLEATGRLSLDVGFDVKGRNDSASKFVLGWTHEEVMTEIASKHLRSYKDLPFGAYQIQTKFRNELRAKSGLLRGREFLMKDLYSFHTSEKDLFEYYEKVREAYTTIFQRCGLTTYYTLADGGDFTISNTHEFQVISDAGEDTIFYCEESMTAQNEEVASWKEGDTCGNDVVKKASAVEVGNIFPLGTKYSDALGLYYTDKEGKEQPVYMGSYGIGVSRLMAVIVEVHSDDQGIVWPQEVAPFDVHLVSLGHTDEARKLYQALNEKKVKVLWDDRDVRGGEKLMDADLMGIPFRVVVSDKTLEKNGYSIKARSATEETYGSLEEVCAKVV